MDAIQLVAAAVMRAAISTFPLFVIVAAITLLGRRWLAPWSRQILWSLVLVRLMLPISFQSPWSLQPSASQNFELSAPPLDPSPPKEQVDGLGFGERDLRPENMPKGYYVPGQPVPAPVAKVDLRDRIFELLLPVGLLSGTIVVGLWTMVTSVRLWRWTRKGRRCEREDLRSLVSEGQRRLGVSGTVTLWSVPGLVGPATYGWWNPTILLPEDVDAWSPLELKHVIWHELAHVRRYDVLLNWGLALVRAVHWWNPMFWIAQRAYLAERELACDAMVLAQLEDGGVREYGETLLKFIERLSIMSSRPSLAAPGFVSFWGRKHEAKRRLSQLAKLAQPERTWCVWLSMALVAILALVGLSDAAPRPRLIKLAPLELPPETTWNVVPLTTEENSEPRSTVDYDLTPLLDQLCDDAPDRRRMTMLRVFEMISLVGLEPGNAMTEQSATQDPAKHWTCMRLGDIIVVHGNEREHAEVKRLLQRCESDGLAHIRRSVTQISNEVRMATTSLSLAELLPGIKGQVVTDEGPSLDSIEAIGLAKTTSSIPTFQAVLTHEEMRSFMTILCQDADTYYNYAPKITTYSGQTATLVTLERTPFITGLSHHEGAIKPHVSIADDGQILQVRATVADDQSIELAVAFQESRLGKVESWNTSFDGHTSTVQLPQVARSLVSVTANIPNGHTLLLVPLRRNEKGQLQLHLFRSELIPEEAYQDEAVSEK